MEETNEYRYEFLPVGSFAKLGELDGYYVRGVDAGEAYQNLPSKDRSGHWRLDTRRVPWKTVPVCRTEEPTGVLQSTVNSHAMHLIVLELVGGYEALPDSFEGIRREAFYEHGQWFARIEWWDDHRTTTITFSVVDTSNGLELEGLDEVEA